MENSFQLFELEQQIDKSTKDLEVLHSCEHTNCSSPSEDISARDIVSNTLALIIIMFNNLKCDNIVIYYFVLIFCSIRQE